MVAVPVLGSVAPSHWEGRILGFLFTQLRVVKRKLKFIGRDVNK